MRFRRVGALIALASVSVIVGAPGCSGYDCESVGCGAGGALVSWYDGAVPLASTYELCVDDVCNPTQPSEVEMSATADSEPGWQVGSPDRPADGESATVRLEVRDAAGVELASYEGRGQLSEGCCAAVLMEVEGDRLVPTT
jgi:hypothetical protein